MLLPRLNLELLKRKPAKGITLKYISLVDMYNNSSNQFILQDLIQEGADLKEALYRVLPEGSQVPGYPSCPCGHLKYGINQMPGDGDRCPKCYQPVQQFGGGAIDTLFWLSTPDHIDKFINPKILIDLIGIKGLERQKFNPWRFLMDPTYKPAKTCKDPLYILLDNEVSDGLERSYNYFANNLRRLVSLVYQLRIDHCKKAIDRYSLEADYRDVKKLLELPDSMLFTPYLPILNSALLQIEQIGSSIFKSETTDVYGRAVTTLALLPHGQMNDITPKQEARLSRDMSDFYMRMVESYITLMKIEGKKPGTVKMDILGSRSDMTFRGVIIPILREHHADECEVPWSFGITLLTPHLIGLLTKDGVMSEDEAINHLADKTLVYDQHLHNLMNQILLDYCNGAQPGQMPGIPISLIRYPSLEVHSNQLLTITVIKTNPMDFSLAISPSSLPGYRGDHDGDELTGQVIMDIRVLRTYHNNHITKNPLAVTAPYRFGRAVLLPAPVTQSFVGYCHIYKNQ